jgi:hypothetical protein
MLLAFALAVLPAVTSTAGGIHASEARNVTTAIYSADGSTTVAVIKAERVFTEKRRIGFFRVRLLPLLVVQGVRLELAQANPDTNWLAGFRVELSPLARTSGSVEWREVSLWLPGETTPRLQAKKVIPATNGDTEYCALEGVTVQTEAGPVQVPRARLLLSGQPGRVVRDGEGPPAQWDLFPKPSISGPTQN